MKENLIKRLELGFQDGIAPNIACGVIYGGDVLFTHYCNTDQQGVFDLASLTKVVFTTTLCALEVQKGRLDLDKKIDLVFDSTAWGACTIRDLLTHQSGLPAWFDCKGLAPSDLLEKIIALDRVSPPSQSTLYSDVGFLLLGLVLEKELGTSLTHLYQGLPAKITKNMHPWESLAHLTATPVLPTGNSAHRKGICGDVHDDNSFFLKGIQPHAGLFGSLGTVLDFLPMWMHGSNDLDQAVLKRFSTPVVAADGSMHAVGWDVPTGNSSAGMAAPSHLIGHLGYTGTSIWIAPEQELGVALLTNRTANQTSARDMKKFRQDVHNIVWSALL